MSIRTYLERVEDARLNHAPTNLIITSYDVECFLNEEIAELRAELEARENLIAELTEFVTNCANGGFLYAAQKGIE